jgi:hypothetical protein
MDRETALKLVMGYATKAQQREMRDDGKGGFAIECGAVELDYEPHTGILWARVMVFRYARSLDTREIADRLGEFSSRNAASLAGGILEVTATKVREGEEPWLCLSAGMHEAAAEEQEFRTRVDALAGAAYRFRREGLNPLLIDLAPKKEPEPHLEKVEVPQPPRPAPIEVERDEDRAVLDRIREELVFLGQWPASDAAIETETFAGWLRQQYEQRTGADASEVIQRSAMISGRIQRLAAELGHAQYVPSEDDLRFRLEPDPAPPSYRDFPEGFERSHYARGMKNAAASVRREMELAGLWRGAAPCISEWEAMGALDRDAWGLQLWLQEGATAPSKWDEALWWTARFREHGWEALAVVLRALAAAGERLWDLGVKDPEPVEAKLPEPDPVVEEIAEEIAAAEATAFDVVEEEPQPEWDPTALAVGERLQAMHDEMRRACPALDQPPPRFRLRTPRLEKILRPMQEWLAQAIFVPMNETQRLPEGTMEGLRRWEGELAGTADAAAILSKLEEAIAAAKKQQDA